MAKLPFKFYKEFILGKLDFEMFQISKLCSRHGTALDIGANIGFYSYYLTKNFDFVHSFEPIQDVSKHLGEFSKKNSKPVLHDYALSNKNGRATILIPYINNTSILNFGYASISSQEKYGKEIEIKTKALDSFNFNEISFIKIDVEGHEKKVIEGGIESIKSCKPTLLIEIEKRHSGDETLETIDMIRSLNYECFYFKKKQMINFNEFIFEKDQDINKIGSQDYINNFFFLPLA